MTEQTIIDGGNKYFHFMLNMADDDLDPYQYRLLGHYRRVCGQGGICFELTTTTAKKTKMSGGKISSVRWELVALGYINIHECDGTEAIAITLIDLMPENVMRYSSSEQTVHVVNSNRSSHELEETRLSSKKHKTPSIPQKGEDSVLFLTVSKELFSTAKPRSDKLRQRIQKSVDVIEGLSVDVATFNAFVAWYRHEKPNLSLPCNPDTVEKNVNQYLASKPPRPTPQNPAPVWDDTPLIGGGHE